MSDPSPVVGFEVVDAVAHVTLDRPDKRNAMNLEVFDQLAEHAHRVAGSPEIGAVLVRGRDGVFSSGLDVSLFGEQIDQDADPALIARLQASFTAYEDLDVPTVAAVEGFCFGGGLQLAIACHLRAVAPSARFAVMEPRWGLIPDLGGSWRLPRLVGLGQATELTLTARRIDAEEARAIGLAEIDLPSQGATEAAHELVARLAAGPGAVRRVPRLLRENLERDRTAALAAEAATQQACLAGPDFTEAVTAHLEGRDARFVGR